jgi:hypothetical protein
MSQMSSAEVLARTTGNSSRVDEDVVRRARLTVSPRLRVPTPRFPFVTLVTIILVGGVVGLLLFNTSMQQASFAATALEKQAQALSERQQTLEMELEDLRDPQRLAETARAQGMVPVSRPAFLRLKDGKILGDPAPATSADQLVIDAPPVPRPSAAFPKTIIDTSSQTGDRPRGHGRNKSQDE